MLPRESWLCDSTDVMLNICSYNSGSDICNKQTKVVAVLDNDNDNDTVAGPIYYHIGRKPQF